MIERCNNLLINDDEYALLSEMLLDTDTENDNNLQYDISDKSGDNQLLSKLIFADELQLVANYNNHYLVFPVQIEKGDFSNFNLTVKAPNIFETGKQLRSWRLLANEKMTIVNANGEELDYKIKDLSASGISLFIDKQRNKEFPISLDNTYLQLSDKKRLAISGFKIRKIDDQTMAYSLEKSIDDHVLTCLTEYLFECHEEQFGKRLK